MIKQMIKISEWKLLCYIKQPLSYKFEIDSFEFNEYFIPKSVKKKKTKWTKINFWASKFDIDWFRVEMIKEAIKIPRW